MSEKIKGDALEYVMSKVREINHADKEAIRDKKGRIVGKKFYCAYQVIMRLIVMNNILTGE